MILGIKICNNKEPQLTVIFVFMYMHNVYKYQS